jgi:HNH endonuclease
MSKKTVRIARRRAFHAQNGLCYYCGKPMCPSQDGIPAFALDLNISQACARALLATAEHLQARSDGGSDNPGNIAAAHALCNHRRHRSKKPMPPQVYCTHVATRCESGKWFDKSLSKRLACIARSVRMDH